MEKIKQDNIEVIGKERGKRSFVEEVREEEKARGECSDIKAL